MIVFIKDIVHDILLSKCEQKVWYSHEGYIWSYDQDIPVQDWQREELEKEVLDYLYHSPDKIVVNQNLNDFVSDIVYEMKKHLNDGQGSEIFEELRKFAI